MHRRPTGHARRGLQTSLLLSLPCLARVCRRQSASPVSSCGGKSTYLVIQRFLKQGCSVTGLPESLHLDTSAEDLSTQVLARLREQFGEDLVRTDPDSLQSYGKDWTSAYQPDPLAVVLPRQIDHVMALVELANELGFALVPSGGRTGLSGGAVARN